VRSEKKRRTLVGDEALSELNYAYAKLKKAWQNLKDENEIQSHKIDRLTKDIEDLETANYELARQKERLKNNENKFKELQTQKEELFAIAVHDIKNPVAAIKSYVELLEEYDFNVNEQREIVKSLVESSEQIMNLAQNMNKVVTAQDIEFEHDEQLTNVSLHEVIKSVANQNIGYANKKKVKLMNNASPDTPLIAARKSKIEEVLFNLINNAIKFSPPETLVVIKSYFTGSNVCVEVTDTGVGIAEEDIGRAFTKGGKLTAVPTGGEESTGLGLWIVKKIIEEHKGSVWVDSKINAGTTFGFKLPIQKSA
jgi:signal transduction histidine kinase